MNLIPAFRRLTARRGAHALHYAGLTPHRARDLGLTEPEYSQPAIRHPF